MSRDYPRQSRVSNVPLGQEPFLQRLDDGKPPAAAIVLPTRKDPSLSSVSVYKQVIIGYLAGLSPLGSIMPHNHDNHRLSSGQGGFFPEWNGGRDFLHKLLTSFFSLCTYGKQSSV